MRYLTEPINTDNFADRAADTALNTAMFALTAIGGLLAMIAIIGLLFAYANVSEAADRAKQRKQDAKTKYDNQLRLNRLATRGLSDRRITHHNKETQT